MNGDLIQGEKLYNAGLDLHGNNFTKGRMCTNIAGIYFELRNKEKFDEWAKKPGNTVT